MKKLISWLKKEKNNQFFDILFNKKVFTQSFENSYNRIVYYEIKFKLRKC